MSCQLRGCDLLVGLRYDSDSMFPMVELIGPLKGMLKQRPFAHEGAILLGNIQAEPLLDEWLHSTAVSTSKNDRPHIGFLVLHGGLPSDLQCDPETRRSIRNFLERLTVNRLHFSLDAF